MIKIKEGDKLVIIKSISKYAIVPENFHYKIEFYYDGCLDYEWKRGSHGMASDLCETIDQAKRKAKYYLKKG